MKMISVALATAAVSAIGAFPAISQAQEALAPTFNVSVISDYRYRGISQTRKKPALQGGVDLALPAGFYVGAWGSTIKWIKDNGVSGPVELDIYGGYKGEIQKDLAYDLGILQYWYVNNDLDQTGGGGVYKNANTTELYGALTFGPVTAKASYALSNLFGLYNYSTQQKSRGSYYIEAVGTFDLGNGFTLAPHIGYQHVAHIPNASYTDYSITVTKDLGSGFSVSLAGVATDADKVFYVPGAAANSTKFLGKSGVVASAKFTF